MQHLDGQSPVICSVYRFRNLSTEDNASRKPHIKVRLSSHTVRSKESLFSLIVEGCPFSLTQNRQGRHLALALARWTAFAVTSYCQALIGNAPPRENKKKGQHTPWTSRYRHHTQTGISDCQLVNAIFSRCSKGPTKKFHLFVLWTLQNHMNKHLKLCPGEDCPFKKGRRAAPLPCLGLSLLLLLSQWHSQAHPLPLEKLQPPKW